MKKINDNNAALDFLSGGTEMGERIRNFDWSQTSLGNPETWDSSLKTVIRIMLTSTQPMCVWWGKDSLINIYNDPYALFLNKKHPEALGKSGSVVWSEVWSTLIPKIAKVFANEGTYDDATMFIMDRKGYEEETYVQFSNSPIAGNDGQVNGLFSVCTDVTQRIINERSLNTLRELGAITFEEKSLDIIYRNVAEALGKNSKDFPFAVVYKITGIANTVAFAASTGIDKNQIIFPNSIEITKPTAITKDFCEAFRENKIVVSDIKLEDVTLPKGAWETAPKQFVYLPVSAASGTHPYCIISAALNPYRKFDETYLQFCKLIGDRISIEINKMLALELELKKAEVLAEIDRAKTVFFSNISHEFRTPLTLMLSPLEEVLNQNSNNLSKNDKQNIETAQRNSLRLLKLVNNLLDFSGIERGRQQAIFSLVDIAVLTKNLAANFRAIIEKAGMKFIVKADSVIQPVYVDKQMWEKIVFNLLSNAFKYTLEGSITVELSSEEDFAILKIKDTGVGIPEKELPKMFQRFHRIYNAAGRTFEGSGIGLSLIKELVLLHHGEITVDSELNQGSVFTVKIPFGKKHVKENEILKTENVEKNEVTADIYAVELETLIEKKEEPNKSHIVKEGNILPIVLVVDDNADMREHIRSLLSNDFYVITANNGMDALHRMKETTPALVLADIMMPVMDGIGLLKEIKSNKATATIPIIFLTARAGEESRIEGLETGADDYLVKPFSSKELVARVKAQIRISQKKESALQDLYNLFNELPFSVAVLKGEELNIEFINKCNLNIWQQKKEDVIGKPLYEVRPDLKLSTEHIHKGIYKTGKPFHASDIPVDITNNDETETKYFNASIDPMFDETGKIVGQVASSMDVTEQVITRNKIEEGKKQLQSIFINAPAAIAVITGPEHTYTLANAEYQKMVNRTLEQLMGKTSKAIFPELVGTGTFEIFDGIYQTGESFILAEYPVKLDKHNDGNLQQMYFKFSAVPLKDGEGKFDSIVIVAIDITEQVVARKKIEQSEKKFEAAILAVQGITWTNNSNGEMFGEQPGWANLTGQSFEEYQGYGWANAIHPDDAQPTVEAWNKAVANRSIFEFEHRVKTKQGNYKLFSIKAVPVLDENGTIWQWVGVHTDITDQREAVQKLAYRTALLEAHNEANVDGILLVDTKGKILSFNQRFIDIWDMPQHIVNAKDDDAALSYAMRQLVSPQQFIDKVRYLYEHPTEMCHDELEFKDGRIIERHGYPVVGEDSTYYAWSWTFTDITSQKNYEKTILEREKQFSTLANNIQNLAWIADAEGWIYWYNQRWYDYTGTTLEEMKGWGWEKVHHPDHIDRVVNFVKQAWQKNEPWELTFPLRGIDGKYRRFLTRVFPVNDAEGKVLRWIGTNTDIEEQKTISEQLEEKVYERTTQLNEVNSDLEQKNIELQKMNQELEAFTYISSHDLQEPVRKIKNFVSCLVDEEKERLSVAGKHYLERTYLTAQRMQNLILDLLTYSRVETGEQKFEKTDLNIVVNEVKDDLNEAAQETGAVIEAGVLGELNINQSQFRQLFNNLIGNSLKFSREGVKSHIVIKSEIADGKKFNEDLLKDYEEKLLPKVMYCHISVSDNGIGFDPEYKYRIFEVFQRLHEYEEFKGTGIGLAICKKIVENHKGIITATGKVNEGATFDIYLPVE